MMVIINSVLIITMCWTNILVRKSTAVFVGCFSDSEERLLPNGMFMDSAMTSTMCMSYCRNFSLAYAGTEFKYECYCGNATNFFCNHSRPIDDCSMTCGGDPNEKCGDHWLLNVHWTGLGTLIQCDQLSSTDQMTTAPSMTTASESITSQSISESTEASTAYTREICSYCTCSHKNMFANFSQSELELLLKTKIDIMKKNLHVSRNTTTAYLRSKGSAPDKRFSSKVLGVFGIFFLSVIFGGIIIGDIKSCVHKIAQKLILITRQR